jgi:hypothetical protein
MDPGIDMSLEDLQTWNYDLVNELRNEKLNGGFTDTNTGITWDTDQNAIQNLSGACALIACGAITADLTWRDHTNVNHTLSPTDLVTLSGGIAVFTQTCYGVSWFHKSNILAMTDIPTLLSYDITAGW